MASKIIQITVSEKTKERLEEFKEEEGLTWRGVLVKGTGVKNTRMSKYK